MFRVITMEQIEKFLAGKPDLQAKEGHPRLLELDLLLECVQLGLCCVVGLLWRLAFRRLTLHRNCACLFGVFRLFCCGLSCIRSTIWLRFSQWIAFRDDLDSLLALGEVFTIAPSKLHPALEIRSRAPLY